MGYLEMFCTECGLKQDQSAKFCAQCGQEQSQTKPDSVSESAQTQSRIACWRCGNKNQLLDMPCSSCGVARPQSREASISVVPSSIKTRNDEEIIERWRTRESSTSALSDSYPRNRVTDSERTGSVGIPFTLGTLTLYTALALLSQGQGLLDNGYCNLYGVIRGSNVVNIYSGKFFGCSPLLTEEMVKAIEDYSAIKFVSLMPRESFSAILYTATAAGVLLGAFLIHRAFQNRQDR